MGLEVRPTEPGEIDMIVDYFHGSSMEHLELMGVDPSRMPPADQWRAHLTRQLALPPQKCKSYMTTWLEDDRFIGFSTTSKIVFGDHAYMHLHVASPEDRRRQVGVACVGRSVEIYFRVLELKKVFCEPNAFNVAPNRTLQRAGFRYVKTHMTVPGTINYHQAVTRWVFEPHPAERVMEGRS